ncbi:glycosyltransferase family 2 protein [Ramlibacter albus]|uniref:Glycosyltransferase family 2 protein n=1 Tax=Ramlibacter albus TaxID=2079448 RepID=A0A923M6B0_9BURK|nr:glycosyltransferase family 2 protein [Ramlibacter albus]MBC5764760.1 glycosyltransferase family 2 protein [Ramlibacter albus]
MNVWACIVCWRADPAAVRQLADVLRRQVSGLLVMDNAADAVLQREVPGHARYVALEANLGTAGAINRAWEIASREGADALVMLDQDSVPEPHMVAKLAAALQGLQAGGVKVAAVGPAKVDPRNGRPGRLLKPVRFLRRFAQPDSGSVIEVDHLITSGSLVTSAAWREAGPLDEALFLDYVDIEWCVRARSKGLRSFCVPGATLSHTIGENVVDVGVRTLSLHAPARTYLLVRNHLLLWRKRTMPGLWLLSDALQVMKKVAGLLALAPQKRERLRAVGRGFADGLHGRGGPL